MIVFPGSKINLGLYIESKRADGYHNIATVMIPIGWSDVLEILESPETDHTMLHTSGSAVDCPPEKNLVMKAYNALKAEIPTLPGAYLALEKIVPHGAGLGGGSADAAACLKALNTVFSLSLSDQQLAKVASTIGADCPFFIYNRPMLATGIGTDLEPIDIDLKGYTLVVAKIAGTEVSTAQAYAGVTPTGPSPDLRSILRGRPETWRSRLDNDFHRSVLNRIPKVGGLQTTFYDCGAAYSAMTGSGSAVFGIFGDSDSAELAYRTVKSLPDCSVFMQSF